MKTYSIDWLKGESVIECVTMEFECMALCMDYARLKCGQIGADKAYIYESDEPSEKIAVCA